ncbi:hypothetical protein NDU88_007349 [Pleurodeles waltl]|uniref:Uncharacterized protein n=1 Tax=Pleurodeles waltl TaxID=8319 RepID=A0AAV7MFI6_PLEWA|nr:hypothetical protein NDU88_007349 [Pleurodeles waltl]
MDVWGSQSCIGHTVAAGVVTGLVIEEKLPCDGDLLVILGYPALECGTSKLRIGSVGSDKLKVLHAGRSHFFQSPEAAWDWLERNDVEGTPDFLVGEIDRRSQGTAEVHTAARRRIHRRHAGQESRVIVRSDGTLSLEHRRQERKEAKLLCSNCHVGGILSLRVPLCCGQTVSGNEPCRHLNTSLALRLWLVPRTLVLDDSLSCGYSVCAGRTIGVGRVSERCLDLNLAIERERRSPPTSGLQK